MLKDPEIAANGLGPVHTDLDSAGVCLIMQRL